MAEKRMRVQSPVREYFRANPNHLISIAEMHEAIGGSRTSIIGAMRTLSRTPDERVELVRRGVYRYLPKGRVASPPLTKAQTAPAAKVGRDVTLACISESTTADGTTVCLMRDKATGDMFTVRPFTFTADA